MKQCVLVTGASGFVGGHIALALAKSGYSVIAQYNNNELAPELIHASVLKLKLELSNAKEVKAAIRLHRPDIIVHSAALTSIELCERDAQLAESSNATATRNIIEALNEMGSITRLLSLSTDLVFDGGVAPRGGFKESDEPVIGSTYGKTKRQAELLVNEYAHGVVFRLTLSYGPMVGNKQGFLTWFLKALRANQEVKMYIDEWRTPIYTQDICRALELAIKTPPMQKLYHLAGSGRINRFDFALQVVRALNYPENLIISAMQGEIPSAAKRSPDVSLNADRFTKEYSYVFLNTSQGCAKLAEKLL